MLATNPVPAAVPSLFQSSDRLLTKLKMSKYATPPAETPTPVLDRGNVTIRRVPADVPSLAQIPKARAVRWKAVKPTAGPGGSGVRASGLGVMLTAPPAVPSLIQSEFFDLFRSTETKNRVPPASTSDVGKAPA